MSLLSNTRRLNRLLQQAAGKPVSFSEMAEVLRDTMQANIYVISRKGKLLGIANIDPILGGELDRVVNRDNRFSEEWNGLFLKIDETESDYGNETAVFDAEGKLREMFGGQYMTVIPIVGGRERLGTLVLTRADAPFEDSDLILAEYGATVIGMEILREHAEEKELAARQKAIVQVAVASLSFSELEAVEHIFEELDGMEGLLVASKIADRVGITRSVIVNALRKLESAGVIETRSLGMKGTYIKILNDQIFAELEKHA